MDEVFVIVGAGLAAAKAAQALRDEGFAGRVVVIGDEADRPYERPPLSKGYLLGDQERAAVFVHGEDWYGQNSVELRLGSPAVGLDRAARVVELADGSRIGYTKLLLATGSTAKRAPGLSGVHYLRRLEDSDRLRAALETGGPVVIAGAGWIGLEVAAAARTRGCPVTVVEPAPTPLHAVLGPELGGFFADVHRGHGVEFRFGAQLSAVRDGVAVTSDGEEIAATTVVVGIGARPNTELAEKAGLAVDNGVVVDSGLRTEDPYIYAAGDVASVPNALYGKRLRVEHWGNALAGGEAAAKAMVGQDVVYDELPYFFSDQYDVGMEFAGFVAPGSYDRVVRRGEGTEFHAFWLAGDRVVAGMHVNRWDEGIGDVQALIRSRRAVDVSRLGDVSVPLSAH
ncbi:NAD(P)/FAD-dependent oxidoreductase [Actinokineospora sp. UTMC 2448]|uniref:NAD(P)/FAD-dependent oxidoreductase n=1 Tax=Actinokineospora sp. UTMC 2448 TaxID=2268449 RepID=UPI00216455E9|nr:FAD-dependent oxidoreductase [Actinokineospora sp. UTMC 2448]UVS81140.1 Rhodocoxin reductase [Actinokineospora sp. UTMC 2448]